MPCKVDPPSVTEAEWLEHMLCQACRYLTKEQINSIRGLDIYQDLWEWYISHLGTDLLYYSKEDNELAHTNLPYASMKMPDEKKAYALQQIERCKREVTRLGLTLEIGEGYISIK